MDRITNTYDIPGCDEEQEDVMHSATSDTPEISGNVITTAHRGFQNVTVDGSAAVLP